MGELMVSEGMTCFKWQLQQNRRLFPLRLEFSLLFCYAKRGGGNEKPRVDEISPISSRTWSFLFHSKHCPDGSLL
jgi:hypothetical protein